MARPNLLKLMFLVLPMCCISFIRAHQHQTIQNNPYWHREILDSQGRYQLEWLVDWSQERVNFNVTVATRGYVALGLARNGKMEGADIVIGGVAPNGRPYFSDRHAIANEIPILDQSQDWLLHSASETQTHTFLSFSRPFDTCDEHDTPITDDTINILWAYGERDNVTIYHYQNRGSYAAYLRDPDLTPRIIHDSNQIWTASNNRRTNRWGSRLTPTVVENLGNAQRWAIREQFKIPAKRTTYWCSVKKFSPPSPGKYHIIGQNIRINPEALSNMHHMILFRCKPPLGVNPAVIFEPFVDKVGQECYDTVIPTGPIMTSFCTDMVGGKAVGGRPMFFPEHVGFPMGDSNHPDEYYLLQVHYDNPEERSDIQSDIQMDVYYTTELRPNEVGFLSLGQNIPGSPSILLPPGEMDHRFYGHCSSSCTRKMIPTEGVKVVAGLLHTHTAGRRIRVQHFRNGRELPWILNDDNYKFEFQPFRFLRNEVIILPGDQVSVQCYYDTTLTNETTVGGYATNQEMCKTFLLYYNRLEEYPICRSEIQSKEYMSRYLAGTMNVTWDQSRLENMATFPPHLVGMTVSEISDSRFVNWDLDLRAQLRKDHIVYPQEAICPSLKNAVFQMLTMAETPDYVSFPVQAKEYQPPQRCTLGS